MTELTDDAVQAVLASLPGEIQVWRSTDTLDHIGTWATTRFPAEAVTYVPKADAQAAVAMAVEKAAKKLERRAELLVQDEGSWEPDTNVTNLPEWAESECEVLEESARLIRDLAPIDGFALVQELRAGVERLNRWRAEEGEKIKRQAKALTDLTKHCQRIEAENAGLARKIGKVQRGDGDHSQIADLEAKVINQRNELANLMARDGRLAELAADRDRLAAANAVLEAKVAGLRSAFRVNMLRFGPPGTSHEEIDAAIDAALATQEAGNDGNNG